VKRKREEEEEEEEEKNVFLLITRENEISAGQVLSYFIMRHA
jgi:hypothetical protein